MTTELPRTPSDDRTRPVPVVVPRRLGDYELAERLGEGGMGVVWRATDGRGRDVAVKVLREHIAHDEQARHRLRREVHTLARVSHPRVAAVLDADVDGPAPYIVTEYVPGPPLDEVVAQRGPLRGEALLRLGRGLGQALHAIHGAGIVHRDLKPGNVLLVGSGEVLDPVVIDFGIAQVADDVRLTMTGMVMGTPGYLPPEVVEGGRVSEATDWWGWAATLAYAASGQPPFGRGPLTVVLDRVLRGRIDLGGVDPDLAPLLRAALDPDPLRRPSEAQVLDGLERYARHEDVTAALPLWTADRRAGADATAGYGVPDETRVHAPVDPTRVAPRRRPDPTRVAARAARPEPGPSPWAAPAAYPSAPGAYPDPGAGAAPWGPGSPVPDAVGTVDPRWAGAPDPRLGRSRRSGSLLAMLVAFVGLAAAAPLLAWGLYAVWSVVVRTVDRTMTGLVLRRHEVGPRRSDVPVVVLTTPWHLLSAVLLTLLSLILGVGLAAVVAVLGSGLLAITETGINLGPDSPLVVAAASLVGAWVAWWGPASTSLRRGSRTVVRAMVPRGAPTLILVTLGVVGGLALVAWSVLAGGAVSWWPMPPEFDPRDFLPVLP